MSDAALFVLVFGGLFVLRGIAATIVFLWILPDGVRCPQCDAETVRMEPGLVLRLLRGFRSSWCLACGWHGVHRVTPAVATRPNPSETPRKTPPATHR
jgi:hypothetical protein